MLQPALPYLDQLAQIKSTLINDGRYKFFDFGDYVNHDLPLASNTWKELQFISIKDDKIIGYFKAIINLKTNNAVSLSIINFEQKTSYTFAKDVRLFLYSLFTEYNLNKINFKTVIDNPAAQIYDNLIKRHGGKVLGIYEKDVLLNDGQLHDIKVYEILKENFRMEI